MPEKDPTTWAGGTWILATVMALSGGLVNWYSKVKAGHVRFFNVAELVGELGISGFTGLGTFMMLTGLDMPLGVCAAAAGIAGHMGTRLIFAAERAVERRIQRESEKD